MIFSVKNFAKIIFIILLLSKNVSCIDIGSDSSVSRFTAQQILNNGDRIAGFACLLAGFKLNNSSVEATFDSFFPVIGDIELKGGTLSLNRDFILHDISAIKTLGNITGNNHTLEIAASVKTFPESSESGGSCGSESCDISYVTNISVSYDVLDCDWSFDDKFIAVALENGSNNLKIYEFNGSILVFKDSESIGSSNVNSVSWHPSDYLLAVGSNSGDEFSVYEVNSSTGVLTKKSGINLSDVNAVAWHPSGSWVAIGQENSTKEIAIYAVDSQGNINSMPVDTYNANDNVEKNSLRWNSGGNYLAAGLDSNGSAELLVFAFNDVSGEITFDCSKEIGASLNAVAWSNASPNFLAVGAHRTYGEMLKIYEFDSGSSTLTQRAAKSDLKDYVWALDWHPSSNCLALGRDSARGYEFRIYYFDSSDYSLDQITGFGLSRDVRCTRWSHDGSYVAQGCDNNNLYVYSAPSCASEVFESVDFTDLKIFLHGDTALNNFKIIFKGESLISGRGNTLDLSGTSTIVIDSNASLCLKDISLEGLISSNIYCTDNTSTLSVDNCKWIMGSNYVFDVGHLEILNDFYIIGGGYNFVYQTDQQSIVKSNSRIILDENVIFSYAPSVANRDLINLCDDTSDFVLRGATLFSTTTGLRLTKGNLIVERKSFINSDGTNYAESVSFGDGSSVDNDLNIETVGAANLEVLSGYVVYDNISG